MTYNLTGMSANVTGIASFIQYINTNIMDSLLGAMFLLIIFSVALISFLNTTKDAGKSMIGASFITVTISLLFLALNIIKPLYFFIPVVLLAFSIVMGIRE